ncbi:MAG: hypothetical protein GX606_07225, partial [Elusimicrobia bacterium]|nr:hypothetical protein [Elusimicrobiota bacterium]
LVPSAFFVTDLGTEKFAFGLGTTSSWGLGTEWHADSFARYAATKSTIEMKDYLITGAYQMTEKFSLGLGLDIDDAMVDKHKKLYQAGMGDGDFRLKATDTSVGFRVAGMYKVNERHQFGAMYRSAIDHKYRGTVMTSNLGNDGVNNYQAVFGGTSYQTDVEAKATLPQGILLGYSYRPNEKWTMNLDLEWTDWSSTKDEVLTYPTETNAVRLAYLQNGVATPRDWDSVLSVGAGAEYALSETWRVRGGGFYRQGPVPGDTWEPNLPDADNFGIALGTGMNLTKSLVLDLAWSMIQYKDRVVDNTVNDTYGGIDGTYKNSANLLYATLTWEF